MKKQNFLNNLKDEGKLELVEPSEEMKESYLKKADNCLKASKILSQNKLYENSISDSYYCMYNSLLALFFKVGIKCENHSASIILLKKLFKDFELFKIISLAKEERIDKQYYVESQQTSGVTENSSRDINSKAESFLIKIKLFISQLTNEEITSIRKDFQDLIK